MKHLILSLSLTLALVQSPVGAGVPTGTMEVMPDPVRHGQTVEGHATGCGSSPHNFMVTFTFALEKKVIYESTVAIDDEGNALLKKKIKKSQFPTGMYTVSATCFLSRDDGSKSDYWTLEEDLRIKAAKKKKK